MSTAASEGLPPEYLAGLDRKAMSAGLLFRDEAGRVLLVEPSYKPTWEIPGGMVEAAESPWQGAARELAEELGWRRPVGRLLVVDYQISKRHRTEVLAFVFDGGLVSANDLVGLSFPDGELLSAGLFTAEQIAERVKPLLANRIAAAVRAAETGQTVLSDRGTAVHPIS